MSLWDIWQPGVRSPWHDWSPQQANQLSDPSQADSSDWTVASTHTEDPWSGYQRPAAVLTPNPRRWNGGPRIMTATAQARVETPEASWEIRVETRQTEQTVARARRTRQPAPPPEAPHQVATQDAFREQRADIILRIAEEFVVDLETVYGTNEWGEKTCLLCGKTATVGRLSTSWHQVRATEAAR